MCDLFSDDAIAEVSDRIDPQTAALLRLFADHGYDLANGDILYHGPDVALDVPPRYRDQVVLHRILEGRAMWFTRNPSFSLF